MRLYNPVEIVRGVFGEFDDGKCDDTRIDDWFECAKEGIEQLRKAANSDLSFPAEFAAKKLSMLSDLIKTGQIDFASYARGIVENHEPIKTCGTCSESERSTTVHCPKHRMTMDMSCECEPCEGVDYREHIGSSGDL